MEACIKQLIEGMDNLKKKMDNEIQHFLLISVNKKCVNR